MLRYLTLLGIKLIDYIKNQQEHHKEETFEVEYRRLLDESGIEIDERFFLT